MRRSLLLTERLSLLAMLGLVALGVAACTGGDAGGPAVGSDAWLGSSDTDADKNGSYSRDEVNAAFNRADTDGDGQLSPGERGGGR